jgi:hypothetical protein
MLEWLQRDLQMTDMVTLYLSDKEGSHDHGIYCALIPFDQIEEILSSSSWDFMLGTGVPGTVEYYEGEEKLVEYLRYGYTSGVEPLVIDRNFYEMKDSYREISEEFRLFHNLYYDKVTNKYIKIDDESNEDTVVVVEPNCIQIRLKEIRQFLAVKEMYLSIQFDCRERSAHSLEKLGFKEEGRDQREKLMYWEHYYGESNGPNSNQAFSRLVGKRLVKPLSKSKSGLWGFAEDKEEKHVEFIIGVDDDGNEITHTSDPATLANNFGSNPNAPHYLTPVYFRKQVLDKYYQQPSKYSVEDSLLRCGGLWCMEIDNHHDDKVCAWLGDIGRDLPHADQLYWRAYNIPPEDSVSKTYFKRQILAKPTDSNRPEHLFRQRYQNLQEICKECLGWQLLLPLDADDDYHFQGLRIPATDEQRDFDELVLSLTKILVDSLNEKRLNTLIPDDQRAELKGSIARLESALNSCNAEGAADCISFLRKLQNLRSSSAAHRKGRSYRKIAKDFGVESQSLRDVFTKILWQALDVLTYFTLLVRSGQIEPKAIEQNKVEEGYAILDELVGFCESDRTDGSVNHDEAIYGLRSKI